MSKRVVILGAGFGGLYTYLQLRRQVNSAEVQITLVNKTNYFLFTPLLHEVATGGLSAASVVELVRDVMREHTADFVQAEVTTIDLEHKVVHTDGTDLAYDVLVVALGASTNYYGMPGAEFCFELKSLADANMLRNRFIDLFERAAAEKDEAKRRKLLSFAVVGGGPTGVELAAEMADLFFDTMMRYYRKVLKPQDVTLALFQRDVELLGMCHPVLRAKALAILTKKGVQVHLKSPIKEIQQDSIVLPDDTKLPFTTVIWTAGVKPNTPVCSPQVELDKGGRIVVDEFLRVIGHTDVFALGDVSSRQQNGGAALPMLAQVAARESETLAANILSVLGKKSPSHLFAFQSQGTLVSLGEWQAIGDLFGVRMSGPLVWWLWRTVYLFKFASWKKRFEIVLQWTINLFSPRDITKA